MADFKTHITTSTVLGVGYAAGAYQFYDVPAPTCILAGALCSVSGMLPDLDSDSGVPLRESLAFAAAFVPMLLVPRMENEFHWPLETIALVSVVLYVFIRFGIGKLLKKYTVHRGMFHSIPAALTFGEVAFLLCANGDFALRAFKACGVLIGFFSHLILDEIWSIRFKGGIGLKSSSGTAMKFFGDNLWGNISCYGKLALFSLLMMADPIWAGVSTWTDGPHQFAANLIGIEEQEKSRLEQLVAKPSEALVSRLGAALSGASPTGTGASSAAPNGTATPQPGSNATRAPATFASQQPSPALLQQQQQQQAFAQQQAYAAQQQLAQQQAAQQQAAQRAYAAQQQASYQQQAYQQWYQQQLYQQQLAQQQAAAYAQYQRQFQQPPQGYSQPQQPYQPQYDPRTQPPQAYQPQPQFGVPPRADYPMTRRY